MILRVEQLSAAYAGIQALNGVSLSIQAGEIVAIVGANGAGKSTLLNCLSGVVPTKSGRIIFDGEILTDMHAFKIARRGLIQVPEGRQILAELTVEENLRLGAVALGGRISTYGVQDVYSLFPILKERKRQLGGTLSGGQQQMLAIGRGLMGGPRLLLLDEPSLGLAPIVTDQLFDGLLRLNAEGLTIVLVEQNASRALEAAGRSYLLDGGRIVLEGASDILLRDEKVIEHYLGRLSS